MNELRLPKLEERLLLSLLRERQWLIEQTNQQLAELNAIIDQFLRNRLNIPNEDSYQIDLRGTEIVIVLDNNQE